MGSSPLKPSVILPRRPSFETILEFSGPLILGVIAAVVWANVGPHSYHEAIHWTPFGDKVNLHFLVNEIFMVVFFGIAAKEITEACLPGGALNPPRRAINPLFATVGGVVGPVGVFFLYLAISGDSAPAGGWGIPTATDIALAWLVARIIFGNGHPAVSFLLLLAVADDGIGLAIIAIFYPNPLHPVAPQFLALVVAAGVFAYLLRRFGVKNFWLYLIGPGLISWLGMYMAHLHPALALVPVIPFLPHGGGDEGMFSELDEKKHDPHTKRDALNAFEHTFKVPVEIGLFFFGLANAGVAISGVGTATWAVLAALIVGKTVGIFGFAALAHLIGFKLAEGMDFRCLFVAAMIAGLGLTVALFVAGVAYDPTTALGISLTGAAKMGALLSAIVAPLAIITAKLIGIKRRPE